MARGFSKQDAARLKQEHLSLLADLQSCVDCSKPYKEEIINAADKLIAQEVINILKDIPVEEINRYKGGLRIKNLRDAGYNSIADVTAADVDALIAINGISRDAAYEIKAIVQDFTDKARKDIKIKLSIDSKTVRSTALVVGIYQYKTCKPLDDEANSLLQTCKKQIQNAISNLEPSLGTFKWLFTPAIDKQKAKDAYDILSALLISEYGIKAKEIIKQIHITEHIESRDAWNDFQDNSIEFFTTLENVYPGILEKSDEVYGLPEELAREILNESLYADGLLCTLRRYQEWGVKYALHQKKVLLGDEMGLGKTVQAIAAMVSLKNCGATHFVVVCPASVITNWCREIRKHSRLSVIKVHGTDRKKTLDAWIKSGGVAVTTYETTGFFELKDDFRFTILVVDEAHYIKNPETARSRHVRSIAAHADRMLFMTGTALENKVDEMINLIDVLQPEIADAVRDKAFMSAAPQFRERIAPVYYRRKREQVLTELPELIENREWCIMTPQEEDVYEKTLYSRNYMAIRRVSWNVKDLQYSSKAQRLREIVDDAREDGRKVIVFSFFLETIKSVRELLGSDCMNPINGSITPQRRQEIIDAFDQAPAGTVLPAQIHSGGTGLNIQSASVVVICEPQYKPSIENQAISRAYRMGQARNVLVYRLLCENSIDERILFVLERKQAQFDAFADQSVAAKESIELDEKTFKQIIEEELERINAKYSRADMPIAESAES